MSIGTQAKLDTIMSKVENMTKDIARLENPVTDLTEWKTRLLASFVVVSGIATFVGWILGPSLISSFMKLFQSHGQ